MMVKGFSDDQKEHIRERINSAQENLENNFSGGLVLDGSE